MRQRILILLGNDDAQDIAEYAVILAVILIIVVGTIRLIGSNANTVFRKSAARFSSNSWHFLENRLILADERA